MHNNNNNNTSSVSINHIIHSVVVRYPLPALIISHRPIMDLLPEILLTALFTAVFYLLVAKLLSLPTAATDDAREFSGVESRISELTSQRRETRESRAQLDEGGIGKVDKFSGERSVDESPEEDLVGGIGCDLAVESAAAAALSEERLVHRSSATEVDDVAVEESCGGGRKLDEFDGVDKENAVAGVFEEKIVEHLMAGDEIVEDVGGDNDSLENSGPIISEKIEKIRGEVDIKETLGCSDLVTVDDVETIVEHVVAGDEINEDVGSDYGRFENSGAIGEIVGKPGVEGAIGEILWSSNPVVVDDDVAVEEMSEKNKLDEYDNVDGENVVAGVSEAMVVEHIGVDSDSLQNLGADDEKVESIGFKTDIMVNSGRNEPLVNEAAAEEKSGGRVFEEKIVEHVGVDKDNSEISGASVGKIENIKVVGDIMVNLGGCDGVVVNQGFHSNIIENVEDKCLIGDENNEKAKVNDEIVTNIGSGDENMKSFTNEDDDWEGIERSELEKDFAAAANYVFHSDKDVCKPKLDNDVKMELYGLNKVALEGPCREPQPMAIKVSARAKWNAWQRLGNMSPEVAMEQYISLLSDKAPEWMEGKSYGDGHKDYSRVSEASRPGIGTYPENQLDLINESVLELNSTTDEVDLTGGSISVNKI